MKKRLFAWLLAICMVFTMLPMQIVAADSTTGFTVSVDGKAQTAVTKTENGYEVPNYADTSTPAYVDLYTVTIPAGTKSVDLSFDSEVYCINSTDKGMQLISQADYAKEAKAVSLDVNGDGVTDFLKIMAYDGESFEPVPIYGIAFEFAASCEHATRGTNYVPNDDGTHTMTTTCIDCNEVIAGPTVEACIDENGDGKCDRCKAELAQEVAVPTRKADYPAESTGKVKTGMAYLLSDLQTGKVFDPVEGQSLKITNYYYERSTDGGVTFGEKQKFDESLFGGTTIQLTENTAGTYVYRFYASHDGVHFSNDTWTLTLTVEDTPTMDFTFYVGQDYNGNYPIIKLYNVETDSQGNEILGDEIVNPFLYSNFTTNAPEGEEAYDVAQGKLVNNYQMFYASLPAGRYGYRAFAKNTENGAYDVALGGMFLDLPTDTNVDGLTGGGTNLYLQCVSFYTSSRKTDSTYFTADEYHVRVDCPIMKTSCTMGTAYQKGSYFYYPTMLYAAGNACLYNSYGYPDIEGYIFTQNINQTFQPSYRAGTKTVNINTAVELTITVPQEYDFGLYFQWNNFNTTEVDPAGNEGTANADRWTVKEDGTKTAVYEISKGNGNYTWRLTDPTGTYVTKSGWIANQNASTSLDFTFAAGDATGKTSHDRSGLGTQVINRDEADLQINLDPKGYEAITGTTRVRAYRHWQIINSDAGNIMVEPDYHWSVLAGDATFETVNGGNTTANWADVTPGTQDSVLAVYYDSVNVSTASVKDGATTFASSSHGGVFPATNPSRVGVIVVGGTGVTHGTADADVDYNIEPGTTTTRSSDWDYNYDTWFYGADETDPALDFAVNATGDVNVEYSFVSANDAMQILQTGYFTAAAGEDGRYSIPLKGFKEIGNGKGGTVIIRMTDSTGVSYRLVRAAQVAITYENVSNPGEEIMPGDQVKVRFDGMFRAVNKISGIFNPTLFKPTYYIGENKFEGTLGQYQRMDNASVTVTIPADLEFAEGAETADCTLTNGYTYGSMYSAANPFAFLYGMTDTGVGTNFNAVTVNYYMNHYADVTIPVSRKVTYQVKLAIKDETGASIDGVAVSITDKDGNAIEANETGAFTLGYGTYSYTLTKDGYVTTHGSFALGSADADKVVDGILTVAADAMPKAGENAWDGTAATEPAKDADGTYLIGTAAELAWFAQNGSKSSAKLTADIELAGHQWTPMEKLYGSLDGQGHVIRNLYCTASSSALIVYLQNGASVKNLGVTGNVVSNAKSNARAAGIVAYMYSGATIEKCFSTVNVTSKKHGGGIAGYVPSGAIITDCYATGTITTSSANECYLGGICGGGFINTAGATLTNCYSTAKVTGSGGAASYVGALSADMTEAHYVNSYYLNGTVSGESSKYGITGKGTAKTADELKALASTLGAAFVDDSGNINNGYPVLAWQLPAPVTSAVSFTAQMAGGFLMAPQYNVEVTSNLAESYGFTDQVAYTDAVSPLDVLVKAHELIFGEAFTPETASELLKVSKSGTISTIFGEKTGACGFFVNNAFPHDGTPAQGGGYNGYVINNMRLYDGDLVEFFVYQDSSYYTDEYAWFVQNGSFTTSLTAPAYEEITLTLKGTMAMMGYTYADGFAMLAAGKPIADAQLALVDAETGAIREIKGAVTGEDGTVTFTAPKEGSYLLTAFMPAAEIEAGSNPVIMTISSLNVTKGTAVPGDINGDGRVTNVDAALVYAAYNGTTELTNAQLALADVNGDGEITNVDAAMIYAYYNGTLDSFPAAK